MVVAASQEINHKNVTEMQDSSSKQKGSTARRNIRFGQAERKQAGTITSPQVESAGGNDFAANTNPDGGVPQNTVRSGASEIQSRQPNHILMLTNTFKTMNVSPRQTATDTADDVTAGQPTIHLPSYADLNSIH